MENSDISNPFHGKVISYAEFCKTNIYRNTFIKNDIKERKELLFLPSIVFETNMSEGGKNSNTYKIVLMGCLTNGCRVNVVLDGINPYFDVLIPEEDSDIFKNFSKGPNYTTNTYIQEICDLLLSNKETAYESVSPEFGKPFKGYVENIQKFVRFSYKLLKKRKNALEVLQKIGYPTFADDVSNYYRVVCRDHLTSFCSWTKLTHYRSHNFHELKGNSYRLHIKNLIKVPAEELTAELFKEKSLLMCWDIETMPSEVDGDVPKPENLGDKMPCIGVSFHWVSEEKPLFQVVLSMFPAAPNPKYLTVICGKETNVMLGFAELVERMRPEIITGFNDGDYDWDWLITRASQTNGMLSKLANKMIAVKHWAPITDRSVMDYNVRTERVKISPDESATPVAMNLTGYLTVDTRVIFRRIFDKSNKSSLKYYLELCKLNSKEDMKYDRMFQIYHDLQNLSKVNGVEWDTSGRSIHYEFDEGTPDEVVHHYLHLIEQNMLVNKYCLVDAQRCQELLLARSVIMDNREISAMSYCSLFDALYRANSMKVRNLTIAVGQREPFNLKFSSKVTNKRSEHKYPGAYVIPPERGLKTSKLSIMERIKKSGYKNNKDCIQWKNTTEEEIETYYNIIEEFGPTPKDLSEIENKYGKLSEKFAEFLKEPIGRPITGLDFASLYPSIIRAYNFSPEYCVLNKKTAMALHAKGVKLHRVVFQFGPRKCEAWFIYHNNELETHKDGVINPNFKFGIYGYILNFLFTERKKVKKEMEVYKNRKEQFEANGEEFLRINKEEYDTIMLKEGYLKSKQLALKVYMNTFYGETGNPVSPFFQVEVAGGITTYSQKSLKKAQKFVEEKGCHVYYGDTDSIYMSIPENVFDRIDRDYYTGKISKLDYWTRLVEITFDNVMAIRDGVNSMFFGENNNGFLQMAYEEVLYPVIFTAKKKYYGIPHENIPNFKPQKLFIRGLDVIKRSASKLLRTTFNQIMWDSVNPDNLYTIMELVVNKIDEIYHTKWGDDEFVKTATYRKGKKNVSVHTFVDRMKEKGHIIKNGETFNYIIVNKYIYNYDYRGRKSDIKIGDRMEFPEVIKQPGYSVDLDYYMEGGINGQLSRLITYEKQFQVKPTTSSEDDLKIAEDKIYNNACKFIDGYCKQYYKKYNSLSKTYRRIFKLSDQYVTNEISDKFTLGIMSASFKKEPDKLCNDNATQTQFVDWLSLSIGKKIEKKYKNYGRDIIDGILCGLSKKYHKTVLNNLQRIYYGKGPKSLEKITTKKFNAEYSVLLNTIQKNIRAFAYIYDKYQSCIDELNEVIEDKIDIDEKYFEEVKEKQDIDIDIELNEETDNILRIKSKRFESSLKMDERYQECMNTIRGIYEMATVVYSNKIMVESIINRLKAIRNNSNGYVERPDNVMKDRMAYVDDAWKKIASLKL